MCGGGTFGKSMTLSGNVHMRAWILERKNFVTERDRKSTMLKLASVKALSQMALSQIWWPRYVNLERR